MQHGELAEFSSLSPQRSKTIRIGVIGIGHMGQHHTRVLSRLKSVELVGVSDVSVERGLETASQYRTRYFEDYNELLEDADPEPTNMWRWHLAEEFEHRTVCSDVYHELSGLNPVFAYFYRLYGYFYAVLHLGRFQLMVSRKLLEHDRVEMTPEDVTASLARDKHARKIMGRRFYSHFIKICSPFYNPLKRREPNGYQAYLAEFEARYDRGAAAAAIAA